MLTALALTLLVLEAIVADLLVVVFVVGFVLALASARHVSVCHLVTWKSCQWIVSVVVPVEGVCVHHHLIHGSNLENPKVLP